MGCMGRFIDGLSADQRDSIIQAQSWGWASMNDEEQYAAMLGRLCLMDHACGVSSWMEWDTEKIMEQDSIRKPPAQAFDVACQRFGMQRVVRACKLRAGKPQPVLMASPQQQILQHNNTPAEV